MTPSLFISHKCPFLHGIHFWWLVLHGHSRSIHHYTGSLLFVRELGFDAFYLYFPFIYFLFAIGVLERRRACWLTAFRAVDLLVGRRDLVPPKVPSVDPLIGRYCYAASSY